MELAPKDTKKMSLVRPRVGTTKTTNKPHIFLHSLKQSKEAKQRKRDRWRRGASSLLLPPSPGGGPLGPSPTLLSSRSLTHPRASRPPSSKAYDYRIVDHTVICHAAAVALPSFVLARRCAGAGAKAIDEQTTPRQKKIVWAVGERGRTTDIIRLRRDSLGAAGGEGVWNGRIIATNS